MFWRMILFARLPLQPRSASGSSMLIKELLTATTLGLRSASR
jgi:hypothetical protein